jgi:predicted nucleic acid-binding protein
MTLYAETSAVLRWLFNEARWEEVLQHLRDATKVVSSRVTLIESRRAIRRARKEGRIAEGESAAILAVLALGAARWALLELSREVAGRAEEAFPVEPVRTLDAIHLASALVLRQALPDLALLSTDERVRANGAQLGFPLLPG